MSDNTEAQHKAVQDMTTEELRSEVYRLQRIRAKLNRKIQTGDAIRDHIQTVQFGRLTDAIERILTEKFGR